MILNLTIYNPTRMKKGNVKMRYEPVAGTLRGISGTGAGKARALLGWVDIDLFYGTAA